MAIPHCNDESTLVTLCGDVPGETLEERRSELLWRYLGGRLEASRTALEQHLDGCAECREALEQERLLAAARRGTRPVSLAVCPSNDEVLRYLERDAAMSPWRRLEIRRHADACPMCGEELQWAQGRVAGEQPAAEARPRRWFSWNWNWALPAAAAAALAIFAVVYPAWFGPRRFARYARIPDVPYELVRAEYAREHPDQSNRFRAATELISLGEYERGRRALEELDRNDPPVEFCMAHVAAREGRYRDAVVYCSRAERDPMKGFVCWYLANVALLAGDLPVARKELEHARHHEPYTEPARRLERIIN